MNLNKLICITKISISEYYLVLMNEIIIKNKLVALINIWEWPDEKQIGQRFQFCSYCVCSSWIHSVIIQSKVMLLNIIVSIFICLLPWCKVWIFNPEFHQLTFSLTISPVSFTKVFVLPLTGLLHSTRGSCRKVFKTLDLGENKIFLVAFVVISLIRFSYYPNLLGVEQQIIK